MQSIRNAGRGPREVKMPPPIRRRQKPRAQVEIEKMERDFWRLFSIEKLAQRWRPVRG